MIIWIAPVLSFLRSALPYALLFLRSIPDLIAPKPTPAGTPYTPPFTGGQCDVSYVVTMRLFETLTSNIEYNVDGVDGTRTLTMQGKILGGSVQLLNPTASNGYQTVRWLVDRSVGSFQAREASGSGGTGIVSARIVILSVSRADGQPDNCGNLSNPTPPPSVADDGLFNPQNPTIGDDNGTVNPASIVLAPALPLVLVSAILAGYSAAMAAAQAALSALDAIKKVAEGLDALKTLWEKLKEFLDEWEKNRPKKRDIVRQTYGRIEGDGALDFFPNNNTKFQAVQLDVVITNIPIGFGRYFGSLSPSRYRFKELGYIAFYSANQGILSTHSIQFKRTSYQIPELAIGFIYHLGLDEQIKGYSFGTFSVEKT